MAITPQPGCVGRGDTGPNPVAGTQITVTPAAIPADGTSRAIVDIYVMDGDGTPIGDVTVTLTATGEVLIEQPTRPTDARGHTQGALYGSTPGDVTLGLQAALNRTAITTPATAQVRLTPSQSSLGNRLSLSISPAVGSVDVASRRSVVVRLLSSSDEPVPGAQIAVSSSRPQDTVSPAVGVTGAAGIFETTLVSTKSGIAQLQAASGPSVAAQSEASFLPGAPDAAHTYFLTQLGNVVAADGLVSDAEVFVGDQFGNPVGYAAVSVAAPAQNVVLVPPTGVADGQGVFHTTLTTTELGSAAIRIDTGTVITEHNVALIVGPPSGATSSLAATPSILLANGQSQASLFAVVQDAAGHARIGDVVTWSSTDANDVFVPAISVTDATGLATGSVGTTHAAAVTLTARAPNLSLVADVLFVPGPPTPATSTLVVTPNTHMASTAADVQLALSLRDAQGNPAPNVVVAFSSTDAGVAFSAAQATTDARGQASVTLAASHSGNVRLVANFGASSLSATLAVQPAALSLAQSTLMASPATLIADGASVSNVTLSAYDAFGNPIAQAPVVLSGQGPRTVLSPGSGSTSAGGSFLCQLSSTQAGNILLQASIGGALFSVPVYLVAGAATAANSQLTLSPASAVANGQSSIAIAVTLADAQGNPRTEQALAFASSGSGDILRPLAAITDANGTAQATLVGTAAGTRNISVRAGALALSAPAILVAGPPSAAHTSLTLSPTSIPADGASQVTLTLVVADAFANPVPSAVASFAATSAGTSAIWTVGGQPAQTGSTDGAGRLVATLALEQAGTVVVGATVGAVTTTSSFVATAGAPSATMSTLSLVPNTIIAGSSTVVRIAAADAFGNPIAGLGVGLSSSDATAQLLPAQPVTTASGLANASLRATAQGTQQVAATLPAGSNVLLSQSLVVLAGPPVDAGSTLSLTPNVIVAGGPNTTLLVTLRDAFGNLAPGALITLASSNGTDVLPATVLTDANGQAACAMRGTQAGVRQLTASSGNVKLTNGFTILAGAVSAAQSTLRLAPNAITADGTQAAGVLLQARDAFGNPTPNVAVMSTGSDVTLNIVPPAGRTDASGQFVAQVTTTSAGTPTLLLAAGGANFTTTLMALPGSAAASMSTLVVTPNVLLADGQATAIANLRLRDKFGNALGNTPAAFAASAVTLGTPSATTDATGLATTTLSATLSGTRLLVAQAANLGLSASATFVAGAPNAALSSFVPSSTAAPANGVAAIALSAVLRDVFGNAAAGANVTLTSSDTNAALTPAAAVTDARGRFVSLVRCGDVGAQSLVASFAGIAGPEQLTTAVQFVPLDANNTLLSLAVTPNVLVADGIQTALVVSTLTDGTGAPLVGRTIALDGAGALDTLQPASATTDANGQVTALVSSTQAHSITLRAQAANVTSHASLTLVAGPASPNTSAWLVSPNGIVADGQSQASFSLTLLDAFGNPLQDAPVNFSICAGNLVLAAPNGVTDAQGQLQLAASGTVAQMATVAATSGNLTLQRSLQLSAGALNAANSSVVATPNAALADGQTSIVLIARAQDSFGNARGGGAFAAYADHGSGNGIVGLPAQGVLDAAGTTTLTLLSTTALQLNVVVSLEGVPFAVPISYYAGAPNATMSTLAIANTPVVADGFASATVLTSLRDAFGNPIAQATLLPSSSDLNVVFAPAAGQTGSDGSLIFQASSTHAGSPTVTVGVQGSNVALTEPIDFVAGPPSAATSSLVALGSPAVANLQAAVMLLLTARDAQGNPTLLEPTTATVGAGQLTLLDVVAQRSASGLISGQSDANGQWTLAATSSVAAQASVVFTIGSVALGANMLFVAGPPDANASTLVISPPQTVADGGSQAALLITVRDAFGNLVANQGVQMAATGQQDLLQPSATTTNSAGIAIAQLSSTVAELKSVTASFGNVTLQSNEVFVAGAASSATTSLTLAPNAIVADGQHSAQVLLVVRDAAGNLAQGRSVQLTGSALSIGPAGGLTDADGTFAAAITSTQAGNVTVQAAVDQVVVAALLNISPGPPDPGHSNLGVLPQPVTADGNAQGAIALSVADAQGNPIAYAPLSLSVGGSNNILGPSTGTTSATGRWASTLASSFAERKTLTVTVLGVPLTATASFVPGAPDATRSSIVVSPNAVTADGTSQAALVVTLSDAQGNPIPNANVSLAAPGATLSIVSGTTDSRAQLTAQLQSTQAGAVSITATAAPTSLSTTLTFVPGLPSAATSVLYASPSQVTADNTQPIVLTLLVRDAYGNRVPSQTVGWAASGLRNTLSSNATVTGADGSSQMMLTSSRAQNEQMSASVGGITLSVPVSFIPGSSAASYSSLSVTPNGVVADGSTQATVTLSVEDSFGNPEANQVATLLVGGSNNILGTTTLITGADGTASTTLASQRAERKTLTAQLANFALGAQGTFVAGAPDGARTTLSATPMTATADGVATITLSLAARDAFGNPTPNQNVQLGVDGASNQLQSPLLTTDGQGAALTTLRSTLAQTKTITVRLGGITKTVQVAFVAGPMSSLTSTLVLSPNHVLADGNSLALLQLSAADAQGNPLCNQAVQIVSSGGASDVLGSPSLVTDTSGAASCSISSTLAGVRTLTASVGASSLTGQLQFYPGAPSTQTSTLQVAPAQLTADGTSYASVVVVAEDAFGNLIPNQNIALTASGSAASFVQAQGTSDASGSFGTQLSSTVAEAKVVTANLGQTTLSANVLFVPGAPSSLTSTLAAVPSQATADGTSTIHVALVLRDAQGNPVPGRAYALSSTGTSNAFAPAGGVTDASGDGSVSWTSTHAEPKTLIATLNGLSLSTTASFLPGAPSLANTTLSVTPNQLTPDSFVLPQLLLAVVDAQGNPVPNQAANITSSRLSDVLQPNTLVSDGNGQATATIAAWQAGSRLVTATLSNFSVSIPLVVLAGAPNQALSTLLVSPNQVTADGVSQATLTVTLSDRAGNPVPNQNLLIQVTGGPLIDYPSAPVTNAAGTATFISASTLAGPRNLTITTGNVVLTAAVAFVPGPVSNAQSSVTLTPNQVVADGNATVGIAVFLADAYRNAIANQAVSFAAGGTSNTFGSPTAQTDGNGMLATSWSSTQAAAKTLVVNVGTTTLSAQALFVAGPPSAQTSSVVVTPNAVVADGQSQASVVLYAQDAFGNAAGNQPVQWGTTGNVLVLQPPSGVTSTTGQASTLLSSTLAQQLNVVAQVGAVAIAAPLQFVAGTPNAALSSLLVSPNQIVAGGNVLATLSLFDAFGNAVPNQSATIGGGSNIALLGPLLPSSAMGQIQVGLTTTLAQNVVLQMGSGSLVLSAPWRVVPGPISAASSQWTATPNLVVAGNLVVLQVRLADALGNPVPGVSTSFASVPAVSLLTPFGLSDATGAAVATAQATIAQATLLTATAQGVALVANLAVVPGAPSASTSQLGLQSNIVVADSSSSAGIIGIILDAYGNPVPNANVTLMAQVPRFVSQHYMASGGSARNSNLIINGVNQPNYIILNSGASAWRTSYPFAVTLQSGNNTLKFVDVDVATIIDYVTVATRQRVTVIEAETGAPSGGASAQNAIAGFYGTGYINFSAAPSATVDIPFALNAYGNPGACSYLRFALGTTTRPTYYVNGIGVGSPLWSATLSPNSWEYTAANCTSALTVGANIFRIVGPAISGFNVDELIIVQQGPKTNYEAESGLLSGNAVVASTVGGYSGSGYVTGLTDANSSVTLIVPVTSETLPSALQTDANGNFFAAWASRVAENKVILASVQNVSLYAPAQFVAGAPSAAQTSLVASAAGNVIAGASVAYGVQALDAFSNPIANVAISFNAIVGTSVSPASSVTDAYGSAVANAVATVAGTSQVCSQVGGAFSVCANSVIVAGAPNITYSTFNLSSNSIVAGSNVTASAVVKDQYGNPVGNAVVTFAASPNLSYLTPFPPTDTSGNTTGVVASTIAQNTVVQISVSGITLGAPLSISPGAPNAAMSSIALAGNAIVGSSNGLLVRGTLADMFANPIPNQSIALNSQFYRTFTSKYANDADGWNSIVSIQTPAATYPVYYSRTAVGDYLSYRYSPSVPVLIQSGNSTISLVNFVNYVNFDFISLASGDVARNIEAETGVLGGGASVSTALTGYNGAGYVAFASNGNSSIGLTYQAASSAQNVMIGYRFQTASMANLMISHNGNFVSNNLTGPRYGGGWVFGPQVMVNPLVGNNIITISSGNFPINIDQIVVTTKGSQTTVEAESGVLSGGAQLEAHPFLSGGYAVSYMNNGNATDKLVVPLASDILMPQTLLTDINGNFTVLWTSSVAEPKTLVISSGNMLLSQSVSFLPAVPSASNSNLSVGISGVASGGSLPAGVNPVGIVVQDAMSNAVANAIVTLSSSNGNDNFAVPSGQTGVGGAFVTNVTATSLGLRKICATITNIFSQCANYTVVAATPNAINSSFSFAGPSFVAGGNVLATVRLVDAYGNPVSSVLPIVSGGQNLVFSPAFPATDSNGVSTSLVSTTLAQNSILQASAANIQISAALGVYAGPASPNTSSFSASSSNAVANNSNAIAVAAHFADIYGNPASGQNVSISAQMARKIAMRYATTGDNNVRLTINGILQNRSPFFDRGPLKYVSWNFSAPQDALLQSGNNTISVSCQSATNFDYLLTSSGDFTDTIEAELGTFGGGATVSQSVSGYTGTGFVNFPTLQNSTVSLTYFSPRTNPNAFFGAIVYSPVNTYGSLAVTNNGVAAGNISVSYGSTTNWASSGTTPMSVIAGNNLIVVQGSNQPIYLDQFQIYQRGLMQQTEAESGQFANGAILQAVYSPYSGAGYVAYMGGSASFTDVVPISSESFAPIASVVDSNGNFSTLWRSSVAEIKQLTVSSGNVVFSSNFNFSAGPPSSGNSFFALAANTSVAGNYIVVAASLYDSFSNAIPGYNVTLSATGSNNQFSNQTLVTDLSGKAMSSYTSQSAATHQLCAQVGNLFMQCQNLLVLAGDPALANSSFTYSSPSVVADGSSTLVVRGSLRDMYNNLVSQRSVSLSTGVNRWVSVRYTSGDGTNATGVNVTLNNATVAPWVFGQTNGWGDWRRTERNAVTLTQNNVFSFNYTGGKTVDYDSFYIYPTNANVIVEAETAAISPNITVANYWPNYTGSGYLDFHASVGATATINYSAVPGDVVKDISFRNSAGGGVSNASLSVNGNMVVPNIVIPATAAWSIWQQTWPTQVTLAPGNNVIQIALVSGNILVDSFRFSEIPLRLSDVQIENTAIVSGSATLGTSWSGYEGTGYIDTHNAVGSGFQSTVLRGEDVISPSMPVSDMTGNFTVAISSTVAETKNLNVSVGTFNYSPSISFVPGPVNVSNSALVLSSNQMTAGTSVVLGVFARDGNLNAISASPVLFSASSGSAVFSANSVPTDFRGVAANAVAQNIAGSFVICSNFNFNGALCANIISVAATPSAMTSNLSLSQNSIVAGASVVATIILRDQYNNICSNQTGYSQTVRNGNFVMGPNSVFAADANGLVTVVVSNTLQAGLYQTSLQSGAAVFQGNFTVSPNVPYQAVATGIRELPAGVINDVTLSVVDSYGNQSPNFVGLVSVAIDDPLGQAPNYYLSSSDSGRHTLYSQLYSVLPGQRQLTLTGNGLVTNTSSFVVDNPVLSDWKLKVLGMSPNFCVGAQGFNAVTGQSLVASLCGGHISQLIEFGSDYSVRVANRCLTLSAPYQAGANVTLQSCSPLAYQQWNFNGSRVVNMKNPNVCLSLTGSAPSFPVVSVNCSGGNVDLFASAKQSRSMTINSEFYETLGMTNGAVALNGSDGNRISLQYTNTELAFGLNANNQLVANDNYCLDLAGQNVVLGANLTLLGCQNVPSQQWFFSGNNLSPLSNGNLCAQRLGAYGPDYSGYFGTAITLQPCQAGNIYQNFIPSQYGLFVNMVSIDPTGRQVCMSLPPGGGMVVSTGSNTNNLLQVATCQHSKLQTVTPVPWSGQANIAVSHIFSMFPPGNWALDAFSYNAQAATNSVGNGGQKHILVGSSSSRGWFGINDFGNHYMVDSNSYLVGGNIIPWVLINNKQSQLWFHDPLPLSWTPISNSNLCFMASSGNWSLNQSVSLASCSVDQNQQFMVSRPQASYTLSPNTTIVFNGLCLDSSAGNLNSGSLITTPCTGAPSQVWTVPASGGPLQNAAGYCIDGNAAGFASTLGVVTCNAAQSQNFAPVLK